MPEKLNSDNPQHLERAADMVLNGEVIAFPFRGIYALAGDMDDPEVAQTICDIKQRPGDKNLVTIARPERTGYMTVDYLPYILSEVRALWTESHALGLIVPSSESAPPHLVKKETVLSIWTEYPPLRNLLGILEENLCEGLAGTSANKASEGTHHTFSELVADFADENRIKAFVEGDFSGIGEHRRQSTSVLDLTHFVEAEGRYRPRLDRLGSVGQHELAALLDQHHFPRMVIDDTTKMVVPRPSGILV